MQEATVNISELLSMEMIRCMHRVGDANRIKAIYLNPVDYDSLAGPIKKFGDAVYFRGVRVLPSIAVRRGRCLMGVDYGE